MVALVSGDPRKAWEDDTEPNDVWDDKRYVYGTLDDAKAFVQNIIDTPGAEHTTTHVEISDDTGLVLYRKDAGDLLADTQPGVIANSLFEAQPPVDERATPLPTIVDIEAATAPSNETAPEASA